ncbi:MAG: polysaccharide biosynthesis/export family protein [Paludibacteraceae bacterium]|nr:polysaccharide biosynthesis/export family protein [Paludibacteraceae bacterium]
MRYMLKKESMIALLFVVLMSSCVTRKDLTSFRTITAETADVINETMKPQPEPRVKINDALIITVSALDPEAVIPYNLPTISYESPTSSNVPTASSFQYYTVDEQGYIDFPILGKLRVVGMRQSEVISLIESKLQGQVVDPIVTMRFLNARVTVLGEVKHPGTYTLNNGRMTLLEALGIAGDLTQYANRSNVLITRENNGIIEFARLDLRNEEIFTSPYFYLQQNDVVYVEPNQARSTSNQSIGLWLSMVGTVASAATVVVSVLSINDEPQTVVVPQ